MYPPFSVWLEDVYIGMLADIYKTSVNDLKSNFVPQTQYKVYSRQEKTDMILKNEIDKTFFVYEPNDFLYFWNLF